MDSCRIIFLCLGGLTGPVLQPPPSAGLAAHRLVHVPWYTPLSVHAPGIPASVVDTRFVPTAVMAKDAVADSHIQASSELRFSILLGISLGTCSACLTF